MVFDEILSKHRSRRHGRQTTLHCGSREWVIRNGCSRERCIFASRARCISATWPGGLSALIRLESGDQRLALDHGRPSGRLAQALRLMQRLLSAESTLLCRGILASPFVAVCFVLVGLLVTGGELRDFAGARRRQFDRPTYRLAEDCVWVGGSFALATRRTARPTSHASDGRASARDRFFGTADFGRRTRRGLAALAQITLLIPDCGGRESISSNLFHSRVRISC